MAPSPENDNTPKAPDKIDKTKGASEGTREKNKDLKTLSNLNDCELKDLLDEAITYKNPKDREGKSSLFKELLSQAEESERNARAASAGGSEQVRYCNTSAKRSKHRRKPNSISENVMHGGSLDNLAKEELFEVAHHLNRSKRTVSSRQREGGSLPSNVNAGNLADPHFFEEARRRRMIRVGGPPEPMDVDMETVSLLEHDSVAENYDRGPPTLELAENPSMSAQNTPKYITNATIQVNPDDPLHINELENVDKKSYEKEQLSAKVSQTNYSVFISNYHALNETTKKVDENGNALHQNSSTKGKKKKIQSDKNVVSCVAEKLEGHRSDIINDVNKLLEYIGENNGKMGGAPNKTNTHRSNKQLHKHTSEEGPRSGNSGGGGCGKKRAQSTKGKENRNELKKSNSLSEISTTKLDQYTYDVDDDDDDNENKGKDEVFLRDQSETTTITNVENKLRERRSWGDVERPIFYKNPSLENIETASSSDFRVVTKKKKTKKRRSSVSGSRRKSSNVASSNYQNSSKSDGDRASSPNPRRKSACSVPHSERSNDDSSDADSVHSLPIDTSSSSSNSNNGKHMSGVEAPISYADIARTTERKVHQQFDHRKNDNYSSEVNGKLVKSPVSMDIPSQNNEIISKSQLNATPSTGFTTSSPKVQPPDVHNIKSFPAINPSNSNNVSSGSSGKERNTGTNISGISKTDKAPKTVKLQQVQLAKSQNIPRELNKVVRTPSMNEDNNVNQNVEMEVQQQFNTTQQLTPSMQIPDVQTIEKIHFMNQPGGVMPAHLQQHVVPPQHIHMQLRTHQMPTMPELFTTNNSNGRTPAYTAVVTHTPHTGGSSGAGAVTYLTSSNLQEQPQQQQRTISNSDVIGNKSEKKNNVSEDNLNENIILNSNRNGKTKNSGSNVKQLTVSSKCTEHVTSRLSPTAVVMKTNNNESNNINTSDELVVGGGGVSGGGVGAATPTVVSVNYNNCCDNSRTISNKSSADDRNSNSKPPPVVILSGGLSNNSKEVVVPGLIFGFDINEQLLSEDICENFVQRFVMPENFSTTSHNHEKIVNYIGLAWEDVCKNQSMGEAHYYSDIVHQ